MPGSRDPDRLAMDLAQARSAGVAALARGEFDDDAKRAAFRLGTLLHEAADSDALWRQGNGAGPASDEQRLALNAVFDVEWTPLLERLGYCGPPPAPELELALLRGMRAVLTGDPGVDVAAARADLRALAGELVERSGQAAPHGLRSALRRGVRAAGPLIILAGAIGAVVAFPEVVPVAAAVSVVASLVGRERAEKLVRETLIGGARWVLGKAFERFRREAGDHPPEQDPADWAAYRAVRVMTDDLYLAGGLLANWRTFAAFDAAEAPPPGTVQWPPTPPTLVASRPLGPQTIAQTNDLVARWTETLYVAWDAALGAPWATPQLHESFDDLREQLRVMRGELATEGSDARRVADALTAATARIAAIGGAFGTTLEPHDN